MSYDLFWNGNKLFSSPDEPLAFDTETELIDGKDKFPRFVLGTAYDGETNCVIGPHQIVDFLLLHADSYFVGHNVAFDFHVVLDEVSRIIGTEDESVTPVHYCIASLWNAASENRICDTMLLDQLIWLAVGKGESNKSEGDGARFFRRGLDSVVKEYLGKKVDKKVGNEKGEYRLRFAELLSVSPEKWHTDVDPGFFEYATTDTVVTWEAYKVMREKALSLQKPFLPAASSSRFSMYHDAVERFGVLTEAIQVKGSIALARISKNGMRVDKDRAAKLEESIRKEFDSFLPFLEENFPQLLQPYVKKEGYKLAAKSGVPCLKNKEIQKLFEEWSPELGLTDGPIKSKGKKGGTSVSVKDWAQFKDKKEFIKRWVEARTLSKRLGFFDLFRGGDFLHPDYNTLVRTGRTSCQNPNTQQMPRLQEFRDCFVPRPGYLMATADYAAIELRTLGAICQSKFGYSVLLDTIKSGIDPHAYTASMFEGMSLDAFMALKEKDPKKFKNGRQAAKACFSGDTELLTRCGWVKIETLYESLKDGEGYKVAQYCPHTKKISFVSPDWVYNEASELIEIETSFLNQCVTPDHRMLLISKCSGSVREVLARDFLGAVEEAWLTVHGGYLETDEAVCSKLVTRLSVMVQADGSFNDSKVRLGFSKKRKIDRCRTLLNQAHLQFEEVTKNGVTTFTLDKGDWYYLSPNKNFLNYRFYDHDAFIEEVGLWDGCVTRKHGATYSSTSLDNVVTAQTILVLNGYKTNLSVDPASGNRADCYSLYWYKGDRKKNPEYARCNKELTTAVKLPGKRPSYCVTVPTSWVLTRRKGKVSVSGNCNFGVPGGLGKVKLAEYAKANYGVTMSEAEAEKFRVKLITDVYPELKQYLASTEVEDLARNLHITDPGKLYDFIFDCYGEPGMICYCLQQVLDGKPFKKDGTPYKPYFVDQMWKLAGELLSLSPHPGKVSFVKDVEKRVPNWKLVKFLFGGTAVTLTGRIRKGVKFTEAKNSPFQGLAADGGKLALFEMVKRGMSVVAFIHDEVLVEVLKEEDACEVEEIMISSMSDVLNNLVPVSVEYNVGDSWKK